MIPYHGIPITPIEALIAVVKNGHAFISFRHPSMLNTVAEICRSFAIDNGAFSAWKSGDPVTDWTSFYRWADECRRIPHCDFAVIPDVIDGDEDDNDALVREWPLGKNFGAPVWHMHESLDRLDFLCAQFPRVCLGSSGEFSKVGDAKWWTRIGEAMDMVCDANGRPLTKLHGLRMLNPAVFSKMPLASADSTNVGRNVNIDQRWKGTYTPQSKAMKAAVLRDRIEAFNAALTWDREHLQH